jgi:hypothetical protein
MIQLAFNWIYKFSNEPCDADSLLNSFSSLELPSKPCLDITILYGEEVKVIIIATKLLGTIVTCVISQIYLCQNGIQDLFDPT